jgi:AcrR family transcriptional regulator
MQSRSEAIRLAALRLFAERGYGATSMGDIGAEVGIKGPSLYKHLSSKGSILSDIMLRTMENLIRDQNAAIAAGGEPITRLRRMVEAHVRYHAAHREEAFVGNREIRSLGDPDREKILGLRAEYEHALRRVIEEGCRIGCFSVRSSRLASYSILDMGMGVAAWFRADGEYSVDEIAYLYADHALRLVGASVQDLPSPTPWPAGTQ